MSPLLKSVKLHWVENTFLLANHWQWLLRGGVAKGAGAEAGVAPVGGTRAVDKIQESPTAAVPRNGQISLCQFQFI